ncbi:hypothetical protein [Stenotrophomonas sp.]|uniref:hypothetical protein n=1 Tax=Stenotrophomonas sp. TaxID=69392 RepID=UPI00289A724B|nr:hypothetical protein [Stenotrophomonas sp.]
MTEFTDFPDDDRNWFILHMDGYAKPHKGTDSTAVECQLVPIPLGIGAPEKLSLRQIAELFGMRDGEAFITTIFVGAVSVYAVGDVFKRSKYVGSLPAMQLRTGNALADGESSALYTTHHSTGRLQEVHAHTEIGRDSNRYPIKVLSKRQLDLDPRYRARSEFLVVRNTSSSDPTKHVEFVIPRMAVYRAFYGFTNKVADIFSMGPWDTVASEAVYSQDFAGNKTGADEETGAWNLVLELGMSKDDATLIALLYFDEYGRIQANRLAIPMQKATERVDLDPSQDPRWYTNARLPLQPGRGPYRAVVSGYALRRRKGDSFQGKILLVRAIHSVNMPEGMPPVGKILINDNTDGAQVQVTDGQKTWKPKPREQRKRPSGMPNVDTRAGSTKREGFDVPALSFEVDPPHPTHDLAKDKSTTRTGARPAPNDPPTNEGSHGKPNGDEESVSHLRARKEKRPASDIHEGLITAMEMLRTKGHIRDFAVIGPVVLCQLVHVAAFKCWNFLTEHQHEALRKNATVGPYVANWSTRCWPYLVSGSDPFTAQERSALVLEVDLPNGQKGFWFEIEMRGTENYSSAFVLHRGGVARREITEALQIIRQASGISMSRHFHSKGIECYCHPHYFEKDASKKNKAKKGETPAGEAKQDDAKLTQVDASSAKTTSSDGTAAGASADPKTTTKPAKTKSGVWSAGPLITFFSRFSADEKIPG